MLHFAMFTTHGSCARHDYMEDSISQGWGWSTAAPQEGLFNGPLH